MDLTPFDEAEVVLTTTWTIGDPLQNSGTLEGSATRAGDGFVSSGVVARWPEQATGARPGVASGGGGSALEASAQVAVYAAAFADQGPSNPKFAFEARGPEVVVRMTASARGQVVDVIEQALRAVPAGTSPNRFKAFAHGTAMAARQMASAHEPGELGADEVFCVELLSVPEIATADGFRRAIMDEGGTRTQIRARVESEELARDNGLPLPDAAGQVLLYQLLDPHSEQELSDQCHALRKVVGERPDLLAHLGVVAKGWADDPDAWWPGEPETDISGPRLLAGVLTVLLPGVPADQRRSLQATLARIGTVPTEDQLTDLGLQ